MANILTKLREVFRLGIEEQPGFMLVDRLKMALDTKGDIDSLPQTEREDNVE